MWTNRLLFSRGLWKPRISLLIQPNNDLIHPVNKFCDLLDSRFFLFQYRFNFNIDESTIKKKTVKKFISIWPCFWVVANSVLWKRRLNWPSYVWTQAWGRFIIGFLLMGLFLFSYFLLLLTVRSCCWKKAEMFAPRAIAQIDDRVYIQCQYHFVIRAYWKRMTCTFNNATRRSFYLTTLSYRTFVARIEFYYRRYRKFSYCAVKFIPVTWDIYNTISLRAYLCVKMLCLSGFSYKLSKFYKVY